MVAFGIRPLISVLFAPDRVREADGCVAAPPASQHCTGPPKDTPEAREEVREFTRTVAQRMPQAVAIEYWNEPNLGKWFWGNKQPNPEHYTHLLCAAHQGVKEANPRMPVLTGGIAGVKQDDPGAYAMSLRNYLNSIYHWGGQDCFDAVGYHSYTDIADIGQEERGHAFRLQVVRDLLAYRGQTNKHIWVTEVGYSGMPEARPEYGVLDEQGQANALRRTAQFFSGQPKVDALIIHQLLHDTGIYNYEHSFSVLKRPDPAFLTWTPLPKLGFCALAVERRGTCDPALAATLPRPPVCADGWDNDGDSLTDHPDDPGCEGRGDSAEADPPPPPPQEPPTETTPTETTPTETAPGG
jgi:hypothetical protein